MQMCVGCFCKVSFAYENNPRSNHCFVHTKQKNFHFSLTRLLFGTCFKSWLLDFSVCLCWWLQIWRPGFDSWALPEGKKKYWVWNVVHSALWVQPRSYLIEKVAAPVHKTENTAVGICHADHVAPSIRKKLAINSPTSGGRSVGIVRSRTQTTKFFSFFCVDVASIQQLIS
jgi:hypothetical protein